MKTKLFLVLLAAIGLTHTISFAQNAENQNPYAIFGSKSYVAGANADQEQVKVFVIENIAEGSSVARLEHNTTTGIVKFFDLDGALVGEKQLKKGERAWPSIDKKAEKYYSISPYAFSLNNPIRYIDPDGMDVWEFDDLGSVVNHIKDKTQDAFHMVNQVDGEWQRSGQGLVFEYGTVTGVRNPTVRVSDGAGGYNEKQLTIFEMKGDNNATQLFEFMANPGVTTNVEWTHAKIGTESSGRNIVGTSHSPSSTPVGSYLLGPIDNPSYTLREVNHNHPSGVPLPSGGDMQNAGRYMGVHPNIGLNIYTPQYRYSPYNASGTIDSRITVLPGGQYILPDGRQVRTR